MLVDPDSSCYWIAKRVFQGVILGNQDSQVLQQILPFSDAVFAVVNWESAHVSDYSGGQHNIAHNALCFHFISSASISANFAFDCPGPRAASKPDSAIFRICAD